MENMSAPVSPNVVDTILITQYKKIIWGTLFFAVIFIEIPFENLLTDYEDYKAIFNHSGAYFTIRHRFRFGLGKHGRR